jgi:hypothetical protein
MAVLLHWFVLVLLFVFFGVKAFFQFNTDFDYMMYHLPFALDFFSLTTYMPNDNLLERQNSFPPLANIMQGLMIYCSGRLSFGNSINFIAAIVSVISIKLLCKENFSVRWFLTACIGIPLFWFHIYSGYIDLWSNFFVLIAFVIFDRLDGKNASHNIWAFSICLLIAYLSRYLIWPACWIMASVYLIKLYAYATRDVFFKGVALVALTLMSWPIHNVYFFNNPLYPFDLAFLNIPVQVNHHPEYNFNLGRGAMLEQLNAPLLFFYSVFELNRLLDSCDVFGPVYHWSFDQGAVEGSPHHRMGGWSPALVVLGLIATFYNLKVRRKALIGRLENQQRRARWRAHLQVYAPTYAVALCLIPTIAISGKNELRYTLFFPLILGYQIAVIARNQLNIIKYSLICSVAWVAWSVHDTDIFKLDLRPAHEHAPAEAVEFWKTTADSGSREFPHPVSVKLDNAIFYAGPTFNSIWVKNTGWGPDTGSQAVSNTSPEPQLNNGCYLAEMLFGVRTPKAQ